MEEVKDEGHVLPNVLQPRRGDALSGLLRCGRDPSIVCVVEEVKDLAALERTGEYRGKYHVLGGCISPLDGIGPEDLRMRELLERLGTEGIKEVILATSPTVEGEATAHVPRRTLSTRSV